MTCRAILVVAMVAACGPKPDPRVPKLEAQLADAKAALAKEQDEAESLRKDDAELKAKADEAKELEAKLAEAVGKAGEVTTADGAVRLELVDQILFPLGEADLTTEGREVLAKVGAALKDVDKQVWVQGHTDDTPIIVKKPKAEPPPSPPPAPSKGRGKGKGKGKDKPKETAKEKPAEPAPEKPNDAVLAFVTNWELSAARALTVVHYLQDEAKLDPSRLAAVAFGQYRPVSKNKAKNRRIEIVLYPRAKISPK